MMSNVKLKEAFDVQSKHGAFYTGGNVEWHNNIFFCQNKATVSLLSTENGSVTCTIGDQNLEDLDLIQTFTVNNDNVVTSHKSGLLKLWKCDGTLVKIWRSIHKGPIAKLVLHDNLLASGGSDGVVRIWNLDSQACFFSLRGLFGVISVVEIHLDRKVIFASGDNGKINTWCLNKGQLVNVYDSHMSKVTCVAFHDDNQHFISCGRDRVLILWNIDESTAIRVIPAFESLESVVCLSNKLKINANESIVSDGIHVASSGNNGVIRIWDVSRLKEIFTQTNSLISKAQEKEGLAIQKLLFNKKTNTFAVVTADHNIILHDLETFTCIKQFVGFSDEILDIVFVGKNDSHIAVATNSSDIKLYETSTMNCSLLKGHTDLVLALSASNVNPNLLLSSAKDNTIRLWLLFGKDVGVCVGIGMAHTASVDSIAFSNLTASCAVSASQDTCLKVWNIPSKFESNSNLICQYTEIAHHKGINSVTISPNDKIIATGSQDKTAKLWTDSLQLLGVLRGHKRGIWCVRFSPVDQVLLTSSTDGSIKLWSITELNCLKTIEGHDASIHRAEFISNGLQIVSAAADGLIKLFTLKSSECVTTLSQHEARIWALAIDRTGSTVITGGADSLMIIWKDVTEEKRLEKAEELKQLILQEQQLSNYLHNDELLKALKLALNLNKPLQTLKIIQRIIKKNDYGLVDTIHQLRNDQKETLLKCTIDWNTNSHNCHTAQIVLHVLIKELQTSQFRPTSLSNAIEGVMPYTERHFKRLTKLMQDLHFLTYTVNCMQPHAKSE